MGRLALIAALVAGLATPAWADFDEGMAAWNRRDYATALRELRPLAEQGHADAQVVLGVMYGEGQGVPEDYAETRKWFRLSAEQGNARAQTMLGIMYAEGRGVAQDYVLAKMWFNLAAAQGSEFAVVGRDWMAEKLTPAQVAEAQRLAREWLEKHVRD